MGSVIAILLVLGLTSIATAQEATPKGSMDIVAQAATTALGGRPGQEAPYVGGRGLITEELATGMFINPTSGTLPQYQGTVQYCALIFKVADNTVVGHGAIATFGVTDWLEVGGGGLLADLPGPADDPVVGGPQVRLRLLKDERWLPEMSVGGVFLFGDKELEKNTVYIAASKGVKVSDTGFVRSARGHIGFRQAWVEVGEDGSFGFVGGEIELSNHLFTVAEVSNKAGGATKVPWAAGIQVRHPGGFGFTLAAVQTPLSDKVAVYVGVGINF